MDVSRTIPSKFILVAGLFAACFSQAQTAATGMVLVGTPSGLSYYDPGITAVGAVQGTLPTVFGGYAGANQGCANPASNSTCDSCAGSTTLTACNPTSIHPNLILTITLQSATAESFQGTPRVRWKFTNETTGGHATVNTPSLIAGQPFNAEIKWADLCAAAGGDATCTTDVITSKTLSVGIDTNNDDTTLEEKVDFNFTFRYVDNTMSRLTASCPAGTVPNPAVPTQGICDYTVARGDEKVYISDYAAASNDLSTTNTAVKYNRLALFYLENTTDPATVTTSAPLLTLNLNNNSPSEPSISDQRITGLVNETSYCFALGNMDQTGNITYFPVQAELVAANADKYCATPSQVVGLLDDKSCFIATATFGSVMAPEVQTFRQFRDQFLLTNKWGTSFVKAYYKFGPEAAEWISRSEFLKTFSLGLLWPLLLFAKLSLKFGLWQVLLGSLLIALALRKTLLKVRRAA